MRVYMLLFISVFLSAGCNNPGSFAELKSAATGYARGFQMEKRGDITKLTVFNPWGNAKHISFEYHLLNHDRLIPDSLAGENIIRVPVDRVICLSTTHLAFLSALDEIDAVVGVSGIQYVSDSALLMRMEKEEVPDVGYGQNLNYELIVSLRPDLVFVYGVDSNVTGILQKLEELGIPGVVMAEYLEEFPLGKTEWIRFAGAFFQKEEEAGEYFSLVEKEYNRLKQLVAGGKNRPGVLVGSPYRDSWWVPGGRSYLARLIGDAGGNYLGKGNNSHESYVISFEHALAWGNEADVWINMGNMASKEEIIALDQRFSYFKVFRQGKIYNNIKRMGSNGGNDFWESGTVHPHLILQDLIHIFYPGLTDEEMTYYKEIK
jgi:iron complex transport system substrate-binding protein